MTAYCNHLQSSDDLVTTYEATRAGFVALAREIWEQLASGTLSNAANLNEENQVASISRWLCSL